MKNVFAHYFTWFSRSDIGGSWEHWNWDGPGVCHNPERYIDGMEDIAAVDIPILGAYDSSDQKVQEYHLEMAEAAGIDAFCVDWYGDAGKASRSRDSIVDRNFAAMLKTACKHNTKLCICYEEKLLAGLQEEAATKTGKRHMKYIAANYFPSQGYWHVKGKPVLVIWGNNRLPVGIWKEILKGVRLFDPWVLYSYHDHNPRYTDICDGFYPWVPICSLDEQKAFLEEYYVKAIEYLGNEKSRTICGGVWPGFNDSGVFGWGTGNRIIEDKNDELYQITWEQVLKNDPEWVSITTWNDWNEGSNIEPGMKKGSKYLKLTSEYISKYKGYPRLPDISGSLDSIIETCLLLKHSHK